MVDRHPDTEAFLTLGERTREDFRIWAERSARNFHEVPMRF
ncbi:MAG: hypothetical protein AAGD40_12375 [Pseudomonadota bacterium]